MADNRKKFTVSNDELVQSIQGSKRALTLPYADTDLQPHDKIILTVNNGAANAEATVQSLTLLVLKDVVTTDALDNGFGSIEDYKKSVSEDEELVVTIVRF